MGQSALSKRLKLSLDELRMQVLGAQVLFGFQFQSLFQQGFDRASASEKCADGIALAAIGLSFVILVIPPCRHRLTERGEITRRLIDWATRCAESALATMAVAFGAIGYAIADHRQTMHAALWGVAAAAVAVLFWFGVGLAVGRPQSSNLPEREMTDLHTKIDHMLTESRVILPGVQAMLGFQLIVVMTPAFEKLPDLVRGLHFTGLCLTGLSVVLLIAPAAVHRLAFDGNDDSSFYRIGTRLVTAALVPLTLSISAEFYVGFWKLTEVEMFASISALAALGIFLLGWFGLPLLARASR